MIVGDLGNGTEGVFTAGPQCTGDKLGSVQGQSKVRAGESSKLDPGTPSVSDTVTKSLPIFHVPGEF